MSWQARLEDERGFTLIELLVVMVIIANLATIAISGFSTQQAKAQDIVAMSQVLMAVTQVETLCLIEQREVQDCFPVYDGTTDKSWGFPVMFNVTSPPPPGGVLVKTGGIGKGGAWVQAVSKSGRIYTMEKNGNRNVNPNQWFRYCDQPPVTVASRSNLQCNWPGRELGEGSQRNAD